MNRGKNEIHKKILLSILFAPILFAQNNSKETTWVIDKSHSKIGFSVTHLVISEVEGYFKDYSAKIVTKGEDFDNAQIEFTAKTSSIFTDNEKRDQHLRSDDFFNSEKYPELKFVGKSFKKVENNKYKLSGDLTIRDVTKPITLDVQFNGKIKDPWGNIRAGFNITGKLNRFDYGLKWNALTELGGAVVDNIVKLRIHIELIKQ